MKTRFAASLVVPLVVATLSNAQTPVFSTETICGVVASNSTGTVQDALPAGTAVAFELESSQFTLPNAGASVLALSQGERVHILTSCFASTRSGFESVDVGTSVGGSSTAPQSWLWTLPGPRIGTIEVQSLAFVSAFGASSIAVDLAADGSDEFSIAGGHVATASLAVNAPNGLMVRITVLSRLAGSTPVFDGVTQSTSLAFRAMGGLHPTYIGPIDGLFPHCGPDIYGADFPTSTRHQLSFTLQRGTPGAQAWLLLGVVPLFPAIPIPGAGACVLELEPLVAISATLDPAGDFVWPVNVPQPTGGETLFVQAATLDAGGALQTSNGLRTQFLN